MSKTPISKTSYLLTFLSFSVWCSALSIQRTRNTVLSFPIHQRHSPLSNTTSTAAAKFDEGFWFTDLTIGNSTASVLIDTGSADLILNAGVYGKVPKSQNLNRTFETTYGTTSGNSGGSSSATATGILYNDTVSFHDICVTQSVGVMSNTSIFPHDGILGLGAAQFSGTNSTPFFDNVCEQGLLAECRFGLALTENGTGSLTMGGVSSQLPGGSAALTKIPILERWFIAGDLAVAGTIMEKDLIVELDSGSAGIVGPIEAVQALFNATGVEGVLQTSESGDTLIGYYPCDSPASMGFSFPSQTNLANATLNTSNTSSIFNVATSSMAMSKQDNNCTSIISGYDFDGLPGLWVVGQAWFQGKYVDHNIADKTIGVAMLSSSLTGNNTSGRVGTFV